MSELIIGVGCLSEYGGRSIDRFQGPHGRYWIGDGNQDGKML